MHDSHQFIRRTIQSRDEFENVKNQSMNRWNCEIHAGDFKLYNSGNQETPFDQRV